MRPTRRDGNGGVRVVALAHFAGAVDKFSDRHTTIANIEDLLTIGTFFLADVDIGLADRTSSVYISTIADFMISRPSTF